MNYLVVDDERPAREEMELLLRQATPDSRIICCGSEHEALEHAGAEPFDIAFLDIELGTSNGILLAKQLKDMQPDIHIIFATSYPHYAVDAFTVRATGYLLKPVQMEHIQRELTFIYDKAKSGKKDITVQTFGGFEIYVRDKRINFKRKKAKELLAYLVVRRGASVSIRDAHATLFEDKPYDKGYFHVILSDLKQALKEAGAEEVLVKSHNSIAIDPDKIDCDYYRFLNGDAQAINSYHGDFLPAYEWADFSSAHLDSRKYAAMGLEI